MIIHMTITVCHGMNMAFYTNHGMTWIFHDMLVIVIIKHDMIMTCSSWKIPLSCHELWRLYQETWPPRRHHGIIVAMFFAMIKVWYWHGGPVFQLANSVRTTKFSKKAEERLGEDRYNLSVSNFVGLFQILTARLLFCSESSLHSIRKFFRLSALWLQGQNKKLSIEVWDTNISPWFEIWVCFRVHQLWNKKISAIAALVMNLLRSNAVSQR